MNQDSSSQVEADVMVATNSLRALVSTLQVTITGGFLMEVP